MATEPEQQLQGEEKLLKEERLRAEPESQFKEALMLARSQRLNLKTDFKWAASGKKLESKYLKVFIKSGNNENPRIGIAVSSKTFAKSTERNHARRLTSAAFEELYETLPEGINILVLPKAGILEVKSQDVLSDLGSLLKNEDISNKNY